MKIQNEQNFAVLQNALQTEGWCYSTDGKIIQCAEGIFQKIGYFFLFLFRVLTEEKFRLAVMETFDEKDRLLISLYLCEKEKVEDVNNPNHREEMRSLEDLVKGAGVLQIKINEEGKEIELKAIEAFTKVHSIFYDIVQVAKQSSSLSISTFDKLPNSTTHRNLMLAKLFGNPTPDQAKKLDVLIPYANFMPTKEADPLAMLKQHLRCINANALPEMPSTIAKLTMLVANQYEDQLDVTSISRVLTSLKPL